MLLTRLQIPPRFSRLPDSKIVTSKPCPTAWAAEDTPVKAAPTMAMRGALGRLLPVGGGGGANTHAMRNWIAW